jgi:DNA-3-methyladenine glycosylase
MLPDQTKAIPKEFFLSEDVVGMAKALLGKILLVKSASECRAGIIAETEAYEGITDRASHAFNNKMTHRTSVMYREGGCCYVYLCYGLHHLFNVVTGPAGQPHAILIRGVKPLYVQELLTGKTRVDFDDKIANGPGKMSKWMGISMELNGTVLNAHQVWLINPEKEQDVEIIQTQRVGVEYAGEDALLPYRFYRNDYVPAAHKKTP